MESTKIHPKSVCISPQNMKGTCSDQLNICIHNGDFKVSLLWGIFWGVVVGGVELEKQRMSPTSGNQS